MALSSIWALGRLHTLKLSPACPCLKAEVGMHAPQPSQSSGGTELRPPESSQGVWERFEIGKALSFGVSVLSLAVSVCPAKSPGKHSCGSGGDLGLGLRCALGLCDLAKLLSLSVALLPAVRRTLPGWVLRMGVRLCRQRAGGPVSLTKVCDYT